MTSPLAQRYPIGTTTMEDNLVVVCSDGTLWMWAPVQPKTPKEQMEYQRRAMLKQPMPHTWVEFHSAIPGSEADAARSSAPRDLSPEHALALGMTEAIPIIEAVYSACDIAPDADLKDAAPIVKTRLAELLREREQLQEAREELREYREGRRP
jgi:hypothetical protein